MIWAVVDTNILARALIVPQGSLGPFLLRLRDASYVLLYSQATLAELADVLGRPSIREKYGISDPDILTTLALILLRGEGVDPDRPVAVCRDPRDDKFLEVAIAGRADAIVTLDEDLLVLHPFEGIPVIAPSAFLKWLDTGNLDLG